MANAAFPDEVPLLIISGYTKSQPSTGAEDRFDLPDTLVREAVTEARRRGRNVVVGYTRVLPSFDPIAVFQRFVHEDGCGQLWVAPDGTALVGIGKAWELDASGNHRFRAVQRELDDLLVGAKLSADEGIVPIEPILMGGFAFDPGHEPAGIWAKFPSAQLMLPRVLYRRQGAETTVTHFGVVGPDDGLKVSRRSWHATEALAEDFDGFEQSIGVLPHGETDFAAWRSAVDRLRKQIQQGPLEKAVLARTLQVVTPAAIDWGQTLYRLRQRFDDCYLFAVARGSHCFLGATPEQLAQVSGNELRTMGLAGSIRRGDDAAEDARLGEALLASAKERQEHELVVRALRDGVAPLCDELHIPEGGPGLRKLANVQHLYTPVRGTLQPNVSILDVLDRIHPTPAVGGYPYQEALEAIRQLEPTPRGWYAGPVGWVDGKGAGEFAVAIRSAQLHGLDAYLFAGCGIVAASDPAEEFAESELKLNVLLEALGATERDR